MSIIVPPIVVLCFVGSYALALSSVDVAQAFLTGFAGYLLIKYNYSIVGLILGPIIEENVHWASRWGMSGYSLRRRCESSS